MTDRKEMKKIAIGISVAQLFFLLEDESAECKKLWYGETQESQFVHLLSGWFLRSLYSFTEFVWGPINASRCVGDTNHDLFESRKDFSDRKASLGTGFGIETESLK